MRKTLVVLGKEWLELRLQRGLLAALLLLAPVLTLLAIVFILAAGRFPATMSIPPMANADPELAGMAQDELRQTIVGKQFGIVFLLLPLFISSVISSYSVVGEKTHRTLEPVLATPVRTWELLLGKTLAALLPAVIVTALCALVFFLGITLFAVSPRVAHAVVGPGWALLVVLWMPLLALATVAATVIVSSRVNDPRTAQQVSAVLIVPVMALLFGQLGGLFVVSPPVVALSALVLAAIAAATVWAATRLFQREVILTRWR